MGEAPFSGSRTLVVILSMHRCGSSLTARLFQRLGMSMGPFELLGPGVGNRHGHFESYPIFRFDQELQQRLFDFEGDMPQSEEVLQRFLKSDGKWDVHSQVSEEELEAGRGLIRQFLESGSVSGFKEPRMVLLWPYWNEVLKGIRDARIVLVTLIRSPHEIAMSIFVRSKGRYTYQDALDIVGANFRRLQEICQTWPGEQFLVHFDPRFYAAEIRAAAEGCGLVWREEAFREIYDESDRHHDPARVQHDAQRVFDELSHLPASMSEDEILRLASDAALREKLIQSQIQEQIQAQMNECRRMVVQLQGDLVQARDEHARQKEMIEMLEQRIALAENTPLRRTVRRLRRVCGQFRPKRAA